MKKILIIMAFALTACTAKAPLSYEVLRSEMARNPEASYLDGLQGKLKWNYTTGLELKSFLDVYQTLEQGSDDHCTEEELEEVLNYVDSWYDAIIAEDGTIGVNYKKSNYSLDHICPGRTLFQLYDITGKEKYRLAMDRLYEQLKEQPRTEDGGFWHKQVYPGQMWLDGLYMAQPFYAEYTSRYVPEQDKAANYEDIVKQFCLAWEHCYDPATDLLRHAWDSTGEMFWIANGNNQSAHAWGRACGWYAMALVDVIPLLPAGEGQEKLISILERLCVTLMKYTDPNTGMWYQVLDRPGQKGNYVEATASAMFIYAMLKGCSAGWIEDIELDAAREKYMDMLGTFVSTGDFGLLNLNRCCEVAGLGGKNMRKGDYDYYINESVRTNDPKGIGPLIWASLEYEKK